jgi:hypothetical protein
MTIPKFILRNALLSFAMIGMLSIFGEPAIARHGCGGGGSGGGGSSTPQTLTAQEAGTLSYMREVEKLARDVYMEMYEKWGTNIFANIATSEQRHMDALLQLLVKYGLPDPALGAGVFSDGSNLQGLYDELVDYGRQSRTAAMEVGVMIENFDIDDLQKAISETNKTDLLNVYGNLLGGSEMHLAAFTSHL